MAGFESELQNHLGRIPLHIAQHGALPYAARTGGRLFGDCEAWLAKLAEDEAIRAYDTVYWLDPISGERKGAKIEWIEVSVESFKDGSVTPFRAWMARTESGCCLSPFRTWAEWITRSGGRIRQDGSYSKNCTPVIEREVFWAKLEAI